MKRQGALSLVERSGEGIIMDVPEIGGIGDDSSLSGSSAVVSAPLMIKSA